jgi:hypothetical protein
MRLCILYSDQKPTEIGKSVRQAYNEEGMSSWVRDPLLLLLGALIVATPTYGQTEPGLNRHHGGVWSARPHGNQPTNQFTRTENTSGSGLYFSQPAAWPLRRHGGTRISERDPQRSGVAGTADRARDFQLQVGGVAEAIEVTTGVYSTRKTPRSGP